MIQVLHCNSNNNSNAGEFHNRSTPVSDNPRKKFKPSTSVVCNKSCTEVVLEGKALWNEFCHRGTEMIVNRAGR